MILGTELSGNPATVVALQQWLVDVSTRLELIIANLRQGIAGIEDKWTDEPGRLYLGRMRANLVRTRNLLEAVDRLTKLLGDCESSLRKAQELMAESEDTAIRSVDPALPLGILVENHRIIEPESYGLAPTQVIDDAGVKHPYNRLPSYTAQVRAFETAKDLVERACRMILDRCTELGKARDFDWANAIFAGVGVGVSDAGLWAQLSQESNLDKAREALDIAENRRTVSVPGWSEDALRTGDWAPVDRAINRQVEEEFRAKLLQKVAAARGGIVRLAARGAPLVQIGNIAYSLANGDPAEKVILSTGAGVLASSAVTAGAAALGFFAGPVGVGVVILVAGIAGWWASDSANQWYEDNIESARDKLARWRQGAEESATIRWRY